LFRKELVLLRGKEKGRVLVAPGKHEVPGGTGRGQVPKALGRRLQARTRKEQLM
jgi:hypothetical protein